MSLMTLDCPGCGEARLFETLHDPADCPDLAASPAGECPDLACAGCGAGLYRGFAIPQHGGLTAGTLGASPSERRQRPERAA